MQLLATFAVVLTLGTPQGQASSLPTCSGSNPDPTDCILAAFNSLVSKKTTEFEEILLGKIEESCSSSATQHETLIQKVDEVLSTSASRDQALFEKVEGIQLATASRDQALLEKVEEMLSTCAARDQELLRKIEEEQNKTIAAIRELFNKTDEPEKKITPNASNCLELFNQGSQISGVYPILVGEEPIRVFCDMDTSNGGPGWTVFQQRKDGTVSFNRTWDDYRSGFGNLEGDHWLGNLYLALITQGPQTYQLRIDMWDWENVHKYAEYSTVRILEEEEDYKLLLGSYSGDAGDSMVPSNNRRFSTPDRDNDDYSRGHCAQSHYWAGWWYGACVNAPLNNPYHHSSSAGSWQGIAWAAWHVDRYSLKQVQMKLRPVLN